MLFFLERLRDLDPLLPFNLGHSPDRTPQDYSLGSHGTYSDFCVVGGVRCCFVSVLDMASAPTPPSAAFVESAHTTRIIEKLSVATGWTA